MLVDSMRCTLAISPFFAASMKCFLSGEAFDLIQASGLLLLPDCSKVVSIECMS